MFVKWYEGTERNSDPKANKDTVRLQFIFILYLIHFAGNSSNEDSFNVFIQGFRDSKNVKSVFCVGVQTCKQQECLWAGPTALRLVTWSIVGLKSFLYKQKNVPEHIVSQPVTKVRIILMYLQPLAWPPSIHRCRRSAPYWRQHAPITALHIYIYIFTAYICTYI